MKNLDTVPYVFYTAVLLFFTGSLFLVPYLSSNPGTEETGKTLFKFYRPMCHQLPSRSFFIFGEQIPVCSRDVGIYGGMLVGALLFPFFFRLDETKLLPIWVMIIAMIPIGIDGSTQLLSNLVPLPFIGVYESNNLLRVATGLLIGGVMSLYAIPLLNGLWKEAVKEN